MDVMRRLMDGGLRAIELVVVLLTVALFAVMLAQVFFRYILNSSLLWSEDVSMWALAWIVFLASVSLIRQWRHVHVPIVLLALPLRWRIPLIMMAKLLTLLFLAFLFYHGMLVFGGGPHRIAAMLGLSTKWLKLAIPAGAGLMALVAIYALAEDLRAWGRGDRAYFETYGRTSAE